jgi:DNA-binding IclR family transcriptional regulator
MERATLDTKEKLTPVGKMIRIIDALCIKPYEFGASEISGRTGIDRSSVRRILNELQEESWIIQDSNTKKFKIGPMIYHAGMIYRSNNNADCKILEVLNDLSERIKESIGYAVRDGDRVMSLYETEIHQPLKLNYHPGEFYPMNKGCYGKCLMAYHDRNRVIELLKDQKFEKVMPNTLTEMDEILDEYDKIVADGYVISDEEIMKYLVGVGVPVCNREGSLNSCIVVAFIKGADYKEKIKEYLYLLTESKNEIEKYV